MVITCFTCEKELDCSCKNEENIRIKFRSCAMRDVYPKSCFAPTSDGIIHAHYCSWKCNVTNSKVKEHYAKKNFKFTHLCANCDNEAPFKCSRCQHSYYCSKACQRIYYKKHKKQCFDYDNDS